MTKSDLPYGTNIIVRADFYPSGQVIPLGITDKTGTTFYIDRTTASDFVHDGHNGMVTRFTCECQGEKLWLIFDGHLWAARPCIERNPSSTQKGDTL